MNSCDHRSKKPLKCLADYIRISEEVSVPVLAQQAALQLNLPLNLWDSQNRPDMSLDGRSLPSNHLGQEVFVLLHGPPDLGFGGCLNRYSPVVRLQPSGDEGVFTYIQLMFPSPVIVRVGVQKIRIFDNPSPKKTNSTSQYCAPARGCIH